MDGSQPEPPDEFCTVCGTRIPGRGSFCPNCGSIKPSLRPPQGWNATAARPAPPYAWQPVMSQHVREGKSWRVVVKSIMAYLMLTYVAFLMVTLVVLVYGIGIVLPEIGDHHYTVYALLPLLTPLFSITGGALDAYYLFLVGAIIASVAWLVLSSLKGFTDEMGMRAKSREHSALFDVCALFFGVLFFDLVLALVLVWTGYAPSDPTSDTPLWNLLFSLANASVWEELVARILLIGIPLLVVDLFRRTVGSKPHRYFLGGGFKIGLVELALILISSTLFGLAHYDSWGAWKIFPAAVAGMAFGYLFLRHGLAAAVVLHFAFDYMSMPTMVFSESLGLTVVSAVGVLLWAGLGLIFFAYFLTRMAEFVTGQKYLEEKPRLVGAPMPFPQAYSAGTYAPAPIESMPPPHGYEVRQPAPVQRSPLSDGYVCPVCGYTQARWADGKFHCMRCGNSS